MRNFYLLGILLCMLMSSRVKADAIVERNDSPVNSTPRLPLSAPIFTPDIVNYYRQQTDISFRASQSNGVGVTEVWRSRTEEENYVLVTTFSESETIVHDYNLSPRTRYKYKMRVVYGSEVSPWSSILYVMTLSKYYEPTVVTTWPYYNDILLTITDNTFYDEEYEVIRIDENGATNLGTFIYPDSGQVFTVWDAIETPGATVTYQISMKPLAEEDPNSYNYNHVVTTTLSQLELINPGELGYGLCGSQNLMFFGTNGDATAFGVEVYRSTNADGPWSLVANLPSPGEDFIDDVAPRVSYYYKARLAKDGVYSPYSNVVFFAGASDWYAPTFDVTLNGSSVQIKLTDNTYADDPYRLYRSDLPSYIETIVMPDSGGVHIFNDTTVIPGITYEYFLEATAQPFCETWPSEDIVATATITTPPIPDYTIASFTLVDPVNDTDVRPLVNGQKITITAPHFLNIRANTDAKTKSVMFFLNNKRRSDNGGPIFSYFPEKNGDYADGLMHQGVYVLEATPYSEKNGKGIKGETVVIEFEVLGPDADYTIKSFALVDPVTDQDIGPLVDGAVVDVSLAANIRAYADPKTKAVMFFLNNKRRADNGAPVFSYFPETNGDFAPGLTVTGHYVLEATPSSEKNAAGIVGETVTIEFDVVCSGCDADEARMAKVGAVSFFPNPVVATSQLKIQTLPGNEVRIQVVDQLGQAWASAITLVADDTGALVHPVSAMNLNKGIYLLRVDVNGAQITKRFSVE
jgi:hypothetical protein